MSRGHSNRENNEPDYTSIIDDYTGDWVEGVAHATSVTRSQPSNHQRPPPSVTRNDEHITQGSVHSVANGRQLETTPKTSWLTPKKVYFAVCILYLISIGTMGGVIGLYWQMHSQVYNGSNNGGGSGVCGFQGNIMNPVPSIIYVIVILGMLAGLLYLWRDTCYGKMFNGSKYEGYACVRFNSAFYMGMNTMLVLAIMCTDAMSWKVVSSDSNEQWAQTARILLATGSISGLLFALLHPICCLCFKGARNILYG